MEKRIAIIGTNGLPGRYGGWDQLLNHLTLHLQNEYSFIVYTSSYNAVKGLKEYNGAKLKIIHLKANGMQSVLYDALSLFHAAFHYDVLLVLGTSGCIFLPIIRIFKKKIVLNPDGQEWRRCKWSTPVKRFLLMSEKFGVKYSDVIIADNKRIQEYVKDTYNKNAELIEYGGDNASFMPLLRETMDKYSIGPHSYAFKVCRIEPENNIELILTAFSKCTLKLIIVGNWNFSPFGKNMRLKYNKFSNIMMLDPIYDQGTLDELRANCGLYVHGHSVGGTNPSLVEAMNLGLCCVVYNVSYNIETTENQAIYFNSENDLIKIVKMYENNQIAANSVREKMKEIAKRRYKWEVITDKYSRLLK